MRYFLKQNSITGNFLERSADCSLGDRLLRSGHVKHYASSFITDDYRIALNMPVAELCEKNKHHPFIQN